MLVGHLYLARQGIAAVDGGAALVEPLFGIGSALTRHIELLAQFVELQAGLVERLCIGCLVGLDVLYVGTAHLDGLVEWLHVEHGIVALQTHFVGTCLDAGFGGCVISLLALGHMCRRLVETGYPLQLPFGALHLVGGILVLCLEQTGALLLLGQQVGVETGVEQALHLALQGGHIGVGLLCQTEYALTHGAVHLSAGQLFEQGCLVGLFGAQKVGKGVLCQYHGACKLLVG